MHIALFGGAFDPPHLGHSLVADSLIDSELVDEVWFIPVFQHPWADRYQKKLSAYHHRLAMIKMILKDKHKLQEYREISYVYNTLLYFIDLHPTYEFSWVMGSEYISRFPDFLTLHPRLVDHHFYLYPRLGFPFDEYEPLPNCMTPLRGMPEVATSSSQVRAAVAANLSIVELTTKEVAKYVVDHHLIDNWQ